ncbi:hypothetical protein Tco_1134549 [Tanacetum coccineum]
MVCHRGATLRALKNCAGDKTTGNSKGLGTWIKRDANGGQVGGQGSEVNDGVNEVPDFSTIVAQQLQNLLPTIVAQVGDQGRGQGNGRNQNDNVVNDNIWGDVSRGCTYKELLAYNPKEYDGKGGAIVYTCWIEKMESAQDMSGCRDSMSWEDFKILTRSSAANLVTLEGKRIERYVYGLAPQIRGMAAATEPKTIQKAVQIAAY